MRFPLLAVAAVGLLRGSAGPDRNDGEVRWRFPVPSKWRAVWGRYGPATHFQRRTVEFTADGSVTRNWEAEKPGKGWGIGITESFRISPESGMPQAASQDKPGGFQMRGDRLRVSCYEDSYQMLMMLKRVK
jgi:hypothetical protein